MNIKEVILCVDLNFKINYISREFRGKYGEYIGKGIEDFEFLNSKLLKESIEKGSSCKWSWKDENGQKFYEFSGSKIHNFDNDIILILCYDVTDEIISKENELRMTRAETALKSKIEFIASVSHELRNPLQAAIFSAENLMNLDLNYQQKNILDDIQSSNKILSSIIDDVLDFSKIEAGKMVVNFSPMDILKVCETSIDLNRIEAKKKGLNLYFIFDFNLPITIYSDELRVIQILNNFLSNAIKYSLKGDIFLKCNLIKKNEKDYIQLSVVDNGVGISPEDAEKLFTPFEKFKNNQNTVSKGWGLGLAICKRFASLLNSEIYVKSNLGKGSTFSIDIPASNSSTENIKSIIKIPRVESIKIYHSNDIYSQFLKELLEFSQPKSIQLCKNFEEKEINESDFLVIEQSFIQNEINSNGIILGEKSLKNFKNVLISSKILSLYNQTVPTKENKSFNNLKDKKILVCEDNPIIHKSLIKMLQNLEVLKLDSAFNGEEAVQKVKQQFYDFILMDIQMPIKNGIEATQEIREYQENKEKSIITCISGNALEKNENTKIDLKFDEILSKPVTKDQLVKVLENYLK